MTRRSTVERLKSDLLCELHLMRPAELEAYLKKAPWSRPSLVRLAGIKSNPLATALCWLPSEKLTAASKEINPFGWLLERVDVTEWSNHCRLHRAQWMTRVWLAAASQLRAERRLFHKASGWADTWEKLRRNWDNPNKPRFVDDHFLAELRHANKERREQLLATPGLDARLAEARRAKDEAFLRRFRRAKHGKGRRGDLAPAEKFAVQYWLELPSGLPGLCFFSDTALHSLFIILRLCREEAEYHVTTLLRVRLGLIQAGAKRHVIEQVSCCDRTLSFAGSMVAKPWMFTGKIHWDGRSLL